MSQVGPFGYLAIFFASVLLATGATPLIRRFALRWGLLDRPGGHKGHSSPIPYLGGLAMAFAFSLALMAAALLRPPSSGLDELAVILGAALGLSVVGLIDDLRGLGVAPRLVTQVLAGLGLHWVGAGVLLFSAGWLNALVTVLWVVGITNAFNLLDNMDGLSAGVAIVGAISFFVIAALNSQYLVAALAIALAGCALGFLKHNFHPARIYMGDAGSLFLGFLLAAIGIKLRFPGPKVVTFFVPILVLGVPIIDTVLVTAGRLVHGRNPLSGGRDHISHRLVFVGIPVPASVALIYGSALAHGWLGVVMSRVDRTTGFILMAFVIAVDLFFVVLLFVVPVYENSRRRRMMIREVRGHERTDSAPNGDEANRVRMNT